MRGKLNRLFWVCWLLWAATLAWLYSQDSSVSAGPVAFAFLAPIVVRVIARFVWTGGTSSR